jgi:hypothetical protein
MTSSSSLEWDATCMYVAVGFAGEAAKGATGWGLAGRVLTLRLELSVQIGQRLKVQLGE